MYFSRINLNLEKCDQSNCPDWCEGRMRAKGSGSRRSLGDSLLRLNSLTGTFSKLDWIRFKPAFQNNTFSLNF